MSFDINSFTRSIEKDGYCIVENVFSKEFTEQTKKELVSALEKEVAYHGTNEYSDYGMVLLCSLYGGNFLELFNNKLFIDCIESVMGEGNIKSAIQCKIMKSGLKGMALMSSSFVIPLSL